MEIKESEDTGEYETHYQGKAFITRHAFPVIKEDHIFIIPARKRKKVISFTAHQSSKSYHHKS